MFKTFLFVCVLAAVSAPAALNGVPVSTTSYTFTGVCQDCPGTPPQIGTGTLVLAGYTQGTALSAANFVSFNYTSSKITFSITAAQLTGSGLTGTIPATLPAPANVSIFSDGTIQFNSQSNGAWCTGIACRNDFGLPSSGSWALTAAAITPTPIPQSLLLVVLGLIVMTFIYWRRRRSAAA